MRHSASLASGKRGSDFKIIFLKLIIENSSLGIGGEIVLGECHRTLLIGSGNGLVPSGKMP